MPVITEAGIIKDRLQGVRARMTAAGITICLVTSDDYHQSEYSGEFFAVRKYLSGFTGSAGSLVILQDRAALFTDGRYFVQAELQLRGTGITLMRQGVKDVPTVTEYMKQAVEDAAAAGKTACVGFDGRTVSAQLGKTIAAFAGGHIKADFDPVADSWTDRPAFPHTSTYLLDVKFAGQSGEDKLAAVRKAMDAAGADSHVLASLDDISWLLNLRADDVLCNPVFMAFMLITKEQAILFANEDAFSAEIRDYLAQCRVTLKPYTQVYEAIQRAAEPENGKKRTFLIDEKRMNYRLYESISKQAEIVAEQNPEVGMKAVKNPVERQNLKDIHVDDGLAVTKFMCWLKQQMQEKAAGRSSAVITELSAAQHLDQLRSEISDYIELSFPTISAYGANAAMMHYAATADNCAELKPEGMLLVDSGGQYHRGTTDITRTFALGPVTAEMKKHFTLTLKGMLQLTHAHFLQGCNGYNLDILARQPLWEQGIDYRCGTGHGIGYLLNVHEAPNGFRWHHIPGVNDLCELQEGMVTSNEPGVYIDGAYGIRIENEILCEKDYENEYGTFMKFATLTMVPIDLDLIDPQYLNEVDITRLNSYHKQVFEILSPHLDGAELEFLKNYTRPVVRN